MGLEEGEEPGGFPLAEHVQQEEGGPRRSGLVLRRPEGWGCGPHRHGRLDCEWLDAREWVSAGVVEDGQKDDGCVCNEHWCSGPRSIPHGTVCEEERSNPRGGKNGQEATDHRMEGFLRWAGGAEWAAVVVQEEAGKLEGWAPVALVNGVGGA